MSYFIMYRTDGDCSVLGAHPITAQPGAVHRMNVHIYTISIRSTCLC
jgi:hypothetical protein